MPCIEQPASCRLLTLHTSCDIFSVSSLLFFTHWYSLGSQELSFIDPPASRKFPIFLLYISTDIFLVLSFSCSLHIGIHKVHRSCLAQPHQPLTDSSCILILLCTLYVLPVIPSVPSLPSSTHPRHIPGIFTVMCYNVLCDKYATRQMYGYCPSWALEWEYRKKGIMDEIKHYIADIITLQVRRRAEGFVSDSKILILRRSFDSALYQLLNLKSPFSLAISQYYLPISLHITLMSSSVFPCHLPLSAFPTYNF